MFDYIMFFLAVGGFWGIGFAVLFGVVFFMKDDRKPF